MSKRRFNTGGSGYGSERKVQRSKVRYGLLIVNPGKPDKDQLVLNIKMINDQVFASRGSRHTTEEFMGAIKELAANPSIRWDRATAMQEFIDTAEAVWLRKTA